ncbi:MAG: hypothetical protein K8R21_04405 [Leptospira sp.]|nr:hypothetical protein [Leptospira sp.]
MKHDGKFFFTSRINTVNRFADYLGGLELIRLEDEIKDEEGRVLIQAKRPLRDSILQSLLNRGMDDKVTLRFENHKGFSGALVTAVMKEIERFVSLSSFSFASHLLKKSEMDLIRVVNGAMQNDFFSGFITLQLYEKNQIMEHLFEVAITATGIFAVLKPKDYSYSDLIHIFQAGILHDFAMAESTKWEEEEDFDKETDHDLRSANGLKDKEIHGDIPEIIQTHNHLEKKYIGAEKKDSWYQNPVELSGIIIKLLEYFCFLKRKLNTDDDFLPKVMYHISLQAEKGYFPKYLLSFFIDHFSKYEDFFHYGASIGKVENMCPHGSYALAYPKPKSTQVVCRDSSIPCMHRLASQNIKVVSLENEKYSSRLGEQLEPGWYEKCAFSDKLPEPLQDL